MVASSHSGILIVLEGIDGAGKTTIAQALAQQLQTYQNVTLTREPGATSIGKSIRELILRERGLDPQAEFLLFAADRAQHFAEIVEPALKRGDMVISDRMADSSLVYQGIKGLDKESMRFVSRWAMHSIEPQLVVYLRIDPVIAQERLAARGKLTKFEDAVLLQQASEAFDELMHKRSNTITVDATKPVDDIVVLIIEHLHSQSLV